MSISRVKVGLPLGGSRPSARNGFKWSGQARSQKNASVSRLRLTREIKSGVRSMDSAVSMAEPQAAPDIADGPLSFLTARQFCALILVTMTAVMLVWGMVSSTHQALRYSYEISKLTTLKTELLEINRRLNADLANQGTLDQLEKTARGDLGLITPQQGQIVVID